MEFDLMFVKILILTNNAVPKSSEDVDNDLSLYKLRKSNPQAGKQLLFLNLYFFAPHFSFPSPSCCTPRALFVQSLYASKWLKYCFRTQAFPK